MMLLVSSLLALSGAPQEPPPAAQAPAILADVIAEARAPRSEVQAYVAEVGRPNPGATLARWQQAICMGVVNLRSDLARQITDRVAAEASAVGVRVRAAGCKPNIVVVATDAARATAEGLVEDDPLYFRPAGGGTDLGPTALRRFVESDAPVRWWHVAMPVSNDTGQMAIALDAQAGEDPPVIADRAVSRLQSTIRSDLAWLIVIVDVTQTGDVPVSALADYISMLALAQINAEADMAGRDTILNLFADPAAPRAMTDWDRSYLGALYGTPTGRPSSRVQARDLERAMTRTLRSPADGDAE